MSKTYEKVLDSRKQLVGQIVEMMEQGYYLNQEGWMKGILTPHNPLSGAVYRGGNKLRLMLTGMMNEYNDPRWMTFKQLREAGYKLKTGQHGVMCEKWIFPEKNKGLTKEEMAINELVKENGKETTSKPRVMVSYFYVFNAQQVEGYPEHELQNELPHDEMFQLADGLKESSECTIHERLQSKAYYSPNNDHIILPPRNAFKSTEAFVSTMMHEMAHSTGHQSRLKRSFGEFGSELYAREELIAELSTIFMAADLGILVSDERLQDNSDYLKSWIRILGNDPHELFRVCADADKAAERVVGHYRIAQEKDVILSKQQQEDKKEVRTKAASIR